MERGDAAAPGEAVGKGQPEKKRYSATERPRDTRDTGSGVPSPPHHRRITTRLCHPRPRPAQRCSPRDGRRAPAVGMPAPSGGTRGRGASRALTPPPRPGMFYPPLTSTAPRRGKLRHGPGRGEGPELGAAGRQRAGNELRLRKQQLPAGPALLSFALPSSAFPSPRLPDPPPRPGGPKSGGAGRGAAPGPPLFVPLQMFGTAGRAAQRNPSWGFFCILG